MIEHTNAYTCTHAYVYMSTQPHVCMHTPTHVHTHVHTPHMHAHVHTHAHAPWWPGSLSQQLVGVGLPHAVVGVPRRLDPCLLSRLAVHFPVRALENLGRTHPLVQPEAWAAACTAAAFEEARLETISMSTGGRDEAHPDVEMVGLYLVKLSCTCQAPILLKNMVFEGKRNKP